MTKHSLIKLTVIAALMVALGALTLGTSTRSSEAAGPIASVTVQAYSAGCGGAITANATVRDVQALPVPGVLVTFSSSGGGTGSGVTNGAGVATTVLSMPVAYNAGVTVSANAGGVVGSTSTGVNCAPNVCGIGYYYGCGAPIAPACNYLNPGIYYPGNIYYNQPYQYNNCQQIVPQIATNVCYAYNCAGPCGYAGCFQGYSYSQIAAKINLTASTSLVNCGGAASISANVTDGFGVPVVNGTTVSFSTSLGTISPTATTGGGNAVASLSTSAGTSGVALITVKAGNASATTTVQVNCAMASQQNVVVYTPGAAQTAPQVIYRPQQQAQPQRPTVVVQRPAAGGPPFAPPRTGDAGLLNNVFANDDAANAALIDSFVNGQSDVTDESIVDSTIVDSNADVDASISNASDQSITLDFDAALIDGNLLGDTDANASLAIDAANVTDHGASDFGLS